MSSTVDSNPGEPSKAELNKELHSLKKDISDRDRYILTLEERVLALEDQLSHKKDLPVGSVSQDFDIENTTVYAIEYDYETERTTIGHKLAHSGKVELVEWSFKTDKAQHEDLVARFRKKLGI